MRVAIVTEGYLPELSGVTTSLQQRVEALGRLGHTVRVYAPDYAPLARLYPDHARHVGDVAAGVTVVPFPSVPYHVDYTRDPAPASLHVVERDLDAFGPDVVHAECPERLSLGFRARPGVRWARRNAVPRTAFFHTNYLAYVEDYRAQVAWLRIPGVDAALRRFIVWVYNSYDVTMVPSAITARSLAEAGVRNAVHDRFLGVDTERFAPDPAARDDAGGRLRVLSVGRLSSDKQIETLLDACGAVRRATDRCEFVFVGGGPEEGRVRAWIGDRDDAQLVGRVPPALMPAQYQRADLLLTASTRENHPLTVLEAMASGLPVVAPAAGGIPAQVESGRSGLLVPPGDAAALARAVLELAASPERRRAMGERARERSLGASWAAATERHLRVWEGLVAARRGGSGS